MYYVGFANTFVMKWFRFFSCVAFITKLNAYCNGQDDTGVKSPDIDVQFLKEDCSITCQVDINKSKTIYWIKLLQQINHSFYDIVHVVRSGQSNVTNWFNCTDLESRSSVLASSLELGTLVLNLNISGIRDRDIGIYKCEANSETYSIEGEIHWNKKSVDWTDCHSKTTSGESSYPKSIFFNIIPALLLVSSYGAIQY